jgi:hypothetical protein
MELDQRQLAERLLAQAKRIKESNWPARTGFSTS